MKISEKKFSFFPTLNQYFPIFHMRQVKGLLIKIEVKKSTHLEKMSGLWLQNSPLQKSHFGKL